MGDTQQAIVRQAIVDDTQVTRAKEIKVGSRLKFLRVTRTKLSQGQAAAAMGISHQALCSYENNRRVPEIRMLIKMANYYEVSVDYLVGNHGIDKGAPAVPTFDSSIIVNLHRLYQKHFNMSKDMRTEIQQLFVGLDEFLCYVDDYESGQGPFDTTKSFKASRAVQRIVQHGIN